MVEVCSPGPPVPSRPLKAGPGLAGVVWSVLLSCAGPKPWGREGELLVPPLRGGKWKPCGDIWPQLSSPSMLFVLVLLAVLTWDLIMVSRAAPPPETGVSAFPANAVGHERAHAQVRVV